MKGKKADVDALLSGYTDDMYIIPHINKNIIIRTYGKKKNIMPALSVAVAMLLIFVLVFKTVINVTDNTLADKGYELNDEELEHGIEILRSKVAAANMTEEEFQQLVDEIGRNKEFYHNIEQLPELKINEYGQTYGVEILKPELVSISTICINENELRYWDYYVKDLYVYWNELHPDNSHISDNVLPYGIKRIMVYLSDGKTPMGYYLPDGRVAFRDSVNDEWTFLTDEELLECIKILEDKTSNANMSEEELKQLIIDKYIFASKYDVNVLLNSEELNVNDYGQTYGRDDLYNPDLIAVVSADGKTGYVYNKDLNPPSPKTIEEALALNNVENVINVYKSDGKTIIGYMSPSAGVVIE